MPLMQDSRNCAFCRMYPVEYFQIATIKPTMVIRFRNMSYIYMRLLAVCVLMVLGLSSLAVVLLPEVASIQLIDISQLGSRESTGSVLSLFGLASFTYSIMFFHVLVDKRHKGGDRRQYQMPINFPDRRVEDRRLAH